MGILGALVAQAAAGAVRKIKGNKMERRVFEIIDKHKAHLDATNQSNPELNKWISEQKKNR